MPESQNGIVLSDSEEVLARGQSVLERLAREAEAARAEARRAELEQILDDARRRGDPAHLRRWLDQFERGRADNPHAVAPPNSAFSVQPSVSDASASAASSVDAGDGITSWAGALASSTTGKVSSVDAGGEITNWEQMLSATRQRLSARAASFESSKSAEPVATPLAKNSSKKFDQEAKPKAASVASGQKHKEAIVKKSPTPKPQELAGKVELKKLAQEFDPALLKQQQEEHAQQRRYSKLRGMLVSLALHVLLVILLAMMAIKLPLPAASLAFESSASDATESFEMTEPLEVVAPSEVSETVPTPDMSVDLSDSLSDLSATTSQTTEGLMATAPSLAAAAMAMANAGSAKPPPMRADSSFFGADASGNNFCYVIDSSGSMREKSAWEAAKGELLRSLSTLKESQRFYIIFFNSELDAIPLPGEREPAPSALYATRENLEHARRWVDTIRLDLGASPLRALEAAVKLEPDAIYLLTDGVTTVDVPKKVREFNRVTDIINGEQVRVPIHAIAYFSLKGESLMKQLAAENNGQFIYVPAPNASGKSNR